MTEYLVFGRKAYPQPLELLGQIHLEGEPSNDKSGLVDQSRQQFGLDGWIEMIAIPQTAVLRVIPVSSS